MSDGLPSPRSARAARRACTSRTLVLGAVALAAGSPFAPPALADTGGVGLGPSEQAQAKRMVVRKISCRSGCASIAAAKAGATLEFQGPMVTRGRRVVYLGAAGATDDVAAKLKVSRSRAGAVATAKLPKRARSGPVAIELSPGVRSPASAAQITLPGAVTFMADTVPLTGPGPFFPIRGGFRFGTGTAAFGGGRDHEGQDVFAACGTPLVAAEGGVVTANAFHARAGNYLVVDVDGGVRDEAYMHLRDVALPKIGERVAAGAPVGAVGETGRADGCHLHFELWNGNWQGVGGPGTPYDPLPTLQAWAAGTAVPAAP